MLKPIYFSGSRADRSDDMQHLCAQTDIKRGHALSQQGNLESTREPTQNRISYNYLAYSWNNFHLQLQGSQNTNVL